MVFEQRSAQEWQEVSTFYKYYLKGITYSERDRPAFGPVCYGQEKQNGKSVDGLDFVPTHFQSLFYINTRKGFIEFQKIIVSKTSIKTFANFRTIFQKNITK